jgi:signal transduction histidine kinase
MKSSALIKRLQFRIMIVISAIFIIILIFSVSILKKEFMEIIENEIEYYDDIIEISIERDLAELHGIAGHIANRSNVLTQMDDYLNEQISHSEAMIKMGSALDYSLEVDHRVKSIYWFDWKGQVVTSSGEKLKPDLRDKLYEKVEYSKIRGPYKFDNSVNFIIYEPLKYKGKELGTEMIVYSAQPFLNTLMELSNRMSGCEKIIICSEESCSLSGDSILEIERFGFRNDNTLIVSDDEFFKSDEFEMLIKRTKEEIITENGELWSFNKLGMELLDHRWNIWTSFNKERIYERAVYYIGRLLFVILILLICVGLGIKLILKPIMGKIIMNENELERTINANLEQLNASWEIIHKNKSHMIEAKKQKSLTRLVQGLAHKINTPMGIILTSNTFNNDGIKFLKGRLDENKLKKEDLELYLDEIIMSINLIDRNADTIIDLITKLKYLSEDKATKKVDIPLVETIKIIAEGLSRELKENNFEVNIESAREIYYYGYTEDIVQVLTNLIINSIQHGKNEDKKNIINITMYETGDEISIKYRDNGLGIAPENLDKIFDPYFTTNFGKGNGGLGLYIVDNIVRNNFKGNISCNSVVGEKTIFVISFMK